MPVTIEQSCNIEESSANIELRTDVEDIDATLQQGNSIIFDVDENGTLVQVHPEVESLNESVGIPTINGLSMTVEEPRNVAENNDREDRGIVECRAPKNIPGPFAKALF
ncbi:uncharacterized protein LOC112590407 [Harpegnathos saltator]|uniref:uncharacterized protein LOC109503696 n=1 Tax=Harpegnathos saltator TaxID=610380 RepID=UPI000948BE3E|nr:uncharacterized protein LOC109503696 [Harpegnathos saltator]XP_025157320.1 uncharacterized protein LOC112589207 [Harpegnathos saltator]XP_025162552.1 uncharacterized protein LOC112590407 [Harpegnathos saltator]